MIWIIEKKEKSWISLTGPDSRVFRHPQEAIAHRDRLRVATGKRHGFRIAAFVREGYGPENLQEMVAGKIPTPWNNNSVFCDKPPKESKE